MTAGPQETPELWRILSIPRRVHTDAEIAEVVEGMTRILRRPGLGPHAPTLFPHQALALFELSAQRGAYLPIGTGQGKTLISLLAPTVLRAKRPLLLVPAKLKEKTIRAHRTEAHTWNIHPMIRIESYELLSRSGGRDLLRTWVPDCVVLDESHKAKSHKAGVTSKLRWYREEHPESEWVCMTGTPTNRALREWAHTIAWCLRGLSCPVPRTFGDLQAWAEALDEKKISDHQAPAPIGALHHLVHRDRRAELGQDREHDQMLARQGFRERLVQTHGVIATTESAISIPIVFDRRRVEPPADVQAALKAMRHSWKTPDGREFLDAMSLWRHCRSLSLGFYNRWEPPPPLEWQEARKAWGAWVRHILSHGRRETDTALDVARAVDAGHYPEAVPALEAWRAVEPTYRYTKVPVWISDWAVEWVAEHYGAHRGGDPWLIWVDQIAFGEVLSQRMKVPYYGKGATSAAGVYIEDHPQDQSAILSQHSCRDGFNLQWSHRMLITSPLTHGLGWEQLLARQHRIGQEADEITVELLSACPEHDRALQQALRDARYIQDVQGQKQKLLLADFAFDPDE